jgi:hypothetical protein
MQSQSQQPFVFTAPAPSRRGLIHSHDKGVTPSFIKVATVDTTELPKGGKGYQRAPGRYRCVFLQPVYSHVEGKSNPHAVVADFRLEMN